MAERGAQPTHPLDPQTACPSPTPSLAGPRPRARVRVQGCVLLRGCNDLGATGQACHAEQSMQGEENAFRPSDRSWDGGRPTLPPLSPSSCLSSPSSPLSDIDRTRAYRRGARRRDEQPRTPKSDRGREPAPDPLGPSASSSRLVPAHRPAPTVRRLRVDGARSPPSASA